MRIAILNAVSLNAGDAAILLGLMAAIREQAPESVDFVVSESAPAVATRLYPGITFVPRFRASPSGGPRLLRSLRKRLLHARLALCLGIMRKCPILGRRLLPAPQRAWIATVGDCACAISTGGTYLVDHYPLAAKAMEISAAHAAGVQVHLYTQSLGPFLKRSAARQMRRILACTQMIFLRDEASRACLLRLGADPERLHVHADAAFALPSPERRSRPPQASLRVALSVRSWRHFVDRQASEGMHGFRDAIRGLTTWLLAQGHHVTFLSTCQGIPEYGYDDARTASDFIEGLPNGGDRLHIDKDFRTPTEISAAYADFDLVIATRMHAAILALIAGTPVIAVAYEPKSTHLFARLGLSSCTCTIESATADQLIAMTSQALNDLPSLARIVSAGVTGLRADTATAAQRIITAVATPIDPVSG